MTLGEKVKAARLARGLSQIDVAVALDTTDATVSRWESDKMGIDAKHIPKLAALLGRDPDWLMGIDSGMEEIKSRLEALETTPAQPTQYSREERELIRLFRGCHDTVRAIIRDKAEQGFDPAIFAARSKG